jgi:hypothetical protein
MVNAEDKNTISVALDISSDVIAGSCLGIKLKEVNAENTTVTINNIVNELSYIGEIPDSIEIDGAFGDWNNIQKYYDDDTDLIIKPNLDVQEYSVVCDETKVGFYFEVGGELLSAVDVPIKLEPIMNVYTQPTIENLDDKHDEITDDHYMRDIPEELIVEDTLRIYLDIDEKSSTGYKEDWLAVGAEYMILVNGRDGRINNHEIYKYIPTKNERIFSIENLDTRSYSTLENIWQLTKTIPAAKDLSRLELSVDLESLGLNQKNSIDFCYILTNWDESIKDDSNLVESDIFQHEFEDLEQYGLIPQSKFDGQSNYMQSQSKLRGGGGTRAILEELVNGTGNKTNDMFGWNVSYAGDVNNDGYDDIIVGAPFYDRINTEWWDTDWSYRKKLTFDNSDQNENLINFPVLVNLSAYNFDYSKAKSDGTDLRFIDSDGSTELKYHIEDWNSSGFSYAWVNVTNIAGGSSVDYIWVYYNNSDASNAQDECATYDDDFVGVWHLDEISGFHDDSTSNSNDGTPSGSIDQDADGKIDGADDFDGNDDCVDVGSDNSLNLTSSMTIEAWIYPQANMVDYDRIVEKGWSESYYFGSGSGTNDLCVWLTNAERATTSENVVSINDWHHVAFTFDDDTNDITIYLDGKSKATGSYTGSIPGCTRSVKIGKYYFDNTVTFNGIIDEVRISDVTRTSDWISAQHLSMNNTFISFGNEEGLGWWDSEWAYRKQLTFDNRNQSEDLINFPILLNLSESNFDYLKAKSDGTDLRFIDEDGATELKYHIEEWNSSSYSYVWVNVTHITANSYSDYIWMKFPGIMMIRPQMGMMELHLAV